tara:strand:- start:265 stop:1197 length:933 start_codon:yes stop_codon:yes gene_type:complete
MKKTYLNIFFQIIGLAIIIKVIFFDEVDFDKFALLKSHEFIILFLLSVVVQCIITYFFLNIINAINIKKTEYIDITSIYLQGGVVNQILPGLGYIYRYYKLKLNSNINIFVYTISQTLMSVFSISAYFLAAFILGFLMITNNFKILFIFFLILISLIFITNFRYKFIIILKKTIYKFKKISSLVNNLKKIKKNFIINKKKFFLIFIGLILLLILECFIFNLSLNYFGVDISLLKSSYIWIMTTILAVLVLVNFFGMFEIIMALSAVMIAPEIDNILIFAINIKIINLLASFLIIIFCVTFKKLFNKQNIQ